MKFTDLMNKLIKTIWIESEESSAIIGGTRISNDNSDVIVTFVDGSQYVATFFTYQNIEHLRKKNQQTGECLNGRYFWASNMLIVDEIERKEIEEVIGHLIVAEEFNLIFEKIEVY